MGIKRTLLDVVCGVIVLLLVTSTYGLLLLMLGQRVFWIVLYVASVVGLIFGLTLWNFRRSEETILETKGSFIRRNLGYFVVFSIHLMYMAAWWVGSYDRSGIPWLEFAFLGNLTLWVVLYGRKRKNLEKNRLVLETFLIHLLAHALLAATIILFFGKTMM